MLIGHVNLFVVVVKWFQVFGQCFKKLIFYFEIIVC